MTGGGTVKTYLCVKCIFRAEMGAYILWVLTSAIPYIVFMHLYVGMRSLCIEYTDGFMQKSGHYAGTGGGTEEPWRMGTSSLVGATLLAAARMGGGTAPALLPC